MGRAERLLQYDLAKRGCCRGEEAPVYHLREGSKELRRDHLVCQNSPVRRQVEHDNSEISRFAKKNKNKTCFFLCFVLKWIFHLLSPTVKCWEYKGKTRDCLKLNFTRLGTPATWTRDFLPYEVFTDLLECWCHITTLRLESGLRNGYGKTTGRNWVWKMHDWIGPSAPF